MITREPKFVATKSCTNAHNTPMMAIAFSKCISHPVYYFIYKKATSRICDTNWISLIHIISRTLGSIAYYTITIALYIYS